MSSFHVIVIVIRNEMFENAQLHANESDQRWTHFSSVLVGVSHLLYPVMINCYLKRVGETEQIDHLLAMMKEKETLRMAPQPPSPYVRALPVCVKKEIVQSPCV